MDFTLASKDDIEQLIKIRTAYLFEDFKDITENQVKAIEAQLPDYFKKHLGNDAFAFVAKEQDKIIASAILIIIHKPANHKFLTGAVGEVLNVYTYPEYRRQGIAQKLMRMVLSYSKQIHLDFVELKASGDGYPLYRKLGFQDEPLSHTPMKYVL